MARCFVIQPFDDGKFDKRYADVFDPAIRAADLEPYRVDKDPSINDLLEGIETGIEDCIAFLADITADNPNVWYELGHAMAAGKPFCVCCSEERTTHFPFDVNHLNIVKYKVGSSSDFTALGTKITERLKAVVTHEVKLKALRNTATTLTQTQGLAPNEMVALTVLLEYQYTSSGVSAWSLQNDMGKAGFTKAAASLALAELLEKKFIEGFEGIDGNGEAYSVFSLTAEGLLWLRQNRNQLVLERGIKRSESAPMSDEDIPF